MYWTKIIGGALAQPATLLRGPWIAKIVHIMYACDVIPIKLRKIFWEHGAYNIVLNVNKFSASSHGEYQYHYNFVETLRKFTIAKLSSIIN